MGRPRGRASRGRHPGRRRGPSRRGGEGDDRAGRGTPTRLGSTADRSAEVAAVRRVAEAPTLVAAAVAAKAGGVAAVRRVAPRARASFSAMRSSTAAPGPRGQHTETTRDDVPTWGPAAT